MLAVALMAVLLAVQITLVLDEMEHQQEKRKWKE
jgi:hypothetical protein